MNVTSLLGRLTKDPELRRGQSGVSFAVFTVATNRRWKDKTGATQEESAFVPCITFGKPAGWAAEHHKGDAVAVTGRLRSEHWEANGTNHSRLVLVAEELQFVALQFGSNGASAGPQPASEEAPARERDAVPF